MNKVFLLQGITQLISKLPEIITNIAYNMNKDIHIIVPSILFANTLRHNIRNINFVKSSHISTIYGIDNSITGNVAPGKKIISKPLRGFLVKKILQNMNLKFFYNETSMANDLCLAMDRLHFYGLNLNDIKLKLSDSLEVLVEFMEKWDSYLYKNNMIDINKYCELKIKKIIEITKNKPFIAINLPVNNLIVYEFMINVVKNIGVVIFTDVDIEFILANSSIDSPFFYHRSFLTEVNYIH